MIVCGEAGILHDSTDASQRPHIQDMRPDRRCIDRRRSVTGSSASVTVELTHFADEAHKGTGDYAYAQVIRFMMAKNPHFRVLALTATPGSNPEAVQNIVNCLHISHIEIRNEESPDIRRYIHNKDVVTHIIPMTEDVAKLRMMLSKIMQVESTPLLLIELANSTLISQ